MLSKSVQSSSQNSQSQASDSENKQQIMTGNKPLGSVGVKISDLKYAGMLG